jgi:hypothetical protein
MHTLVITLCEFHMFGCLLLGQWWKQTETFFGQFTNKIANTCSAMSVRVGPHGKIGTEF